MANPIPHTFCYAHRKRQARLAHRFEVSGEQDLDHFLSPDRDKSFRSPSGLSSGWPSCNNLGSIEAGAGSRGRVLAGQAQGGAGGPAAEPSGTVLGASASSRPTAMALPSDGKKGVTFAVSSVEGEHAGHTRMSMDCSSFAAGNDAFGLPTISGCVIEQAVQAAQPNALSREGSLLALNSSMSGRPSIALQHSNTNPLLRRLLDPDYSFSAQNSGDLPSPLGGSGCRRPRRFEVEGDDRSSFLFNDDEDRWGDRGTEGGGGRRPCSVLWGGRDDASVSD